MVWLKEQFAKLLNVDWPGKQKFHPC